MEEKTLFCKEVALKADRIIAGPGKYRQPVWVNVRLERKSFKFHSDRYRVDVRFGRARQEAHVKKTIPSKDEAHARTQYDRVISELEAGNYRISQKGHGWGIDLLFDPTNY